jgi:hypothetical protein
VVTLFDYQVKAIEEMKNGCILCGGVGSGKSLTAVSYYYLQNGGEISSLIGGEYVPMNDPLQDLYIITTAHKRDTLEWEGELSPFLISTNPEVNIYYKHKVVIDSWNNIRKYQNVRNAFFIFDEQRVIGSGAWVKAFLKITRSNDWILLSATPGDTWSDYIPVFVANGFFKNRSEFLREHALYSPFTKFPKIDRFYNTGKLIKFRNSILINMDFKRKTVPHHENITVPYDYELYKETSKKRWDPYKNEPIQNASVLCYIWRKIVNSDPSRKKEVLNLFKTHPKLIIFYNFDYELDILRKIKFGNSVPVAEWNGHKHQLLPTGKTWVYLVQYTSGCEGWNCITTDTIIFYSQNYSYRVMTQAAGRTDRLTTPYKDLYYYHLVSKSGIDLGIGRALKLKRDFNEIGYVNKYSIEKKGK